MLALLTYADIGAVNPTALSPWKAENLWRVYLSTANYLNRSVDDDRFHSAGHDEQVARIRLLAPQLGRRLRDFLEGLAAALSRHACRRRDHSARGNGLAAQV